MGYRGYRVTSIPPVMFVLFYGPICMLSFSPSFVYYLHVYICLAGYFSLLVIIRTVYLANFVTLKTNIHSRALDIGHRYIEDEHSPKGIEHLYIEDRLHSRALDTVILMINIHSSVLNIVILKTNIHPKALNIVTLKANIHPRA